MNFLVMDILFGFVVRKSGMECSGNESGEALSSKCLEETYIPPLFARHSTNTVLGLQYEFGVVYVPECVLR